GPRAWPRQRSPPPGLTSWARRAHNRPSAPRVVSPASARVRKHGVQPHWRRGIGLFAGAVLVTLATGCGHAPSTLEPRGPGAQRIATLWWFMFAVSAAVVVAVGALVLYAALRRRRSAAPTEE